MSLFSQEKVGSSLWTYFYIAAGGLGSLLMLFLIKQSLPFNKQEATEYYQEVYTAKQEIDDLEKKLLELKYSSYRSSDRLNLSLDFTGSAIKKLEEVPKFFDVEQQTLIKSKLETQKILLTSKAKLVEQFQTSQEALNQSCSYFPNLKNELTKNPQILGNNSLVANSNLFTSVDSLLTTSILYCQGQDQKLVSTIKEHTQRIEALLKQDKFAESKIVVTEFINHGDTLIKQRQDIDGLFKQIASIDLGKQLEEIEVYYFEQYQKSLNKIEIYRFLTSLFILGITSFIAYRIISNLARTNRNIVKVLEGFTQELETKVEQRTAQLEDSIQNTEAALTQAQKANKAKSTFLANMSHELRTPLNAILGFTQLMCRDSSIDLEHQENLKIINRSGEHLLRLINDILELSKIEVGQITFNETKFNLYTVLNSLEEMLRLKAKSQNLALIFNIDSNVPQFIYTDEGKLRQIIINLLSNALKFTTKGSVTLTVKLEDDHKLKQNNQIDFLFSDTYSLHFAVEDTGPGIDAAEMTQLFSPFEQTKIGRTSNEGTGLGLYICRKFVDLMGGEIKVDSKVGQGSIFSFYILLRVQETKADSALNLANIADPVEQKIISLVPGQQKYRILVVDDVAPSRLLLNKLLSQIGYLVQEASNGQEAIEKWRSWLPNLILMDMRMPIMDGYEATKQIKSQPQGKKTTVIALTASAFEEERIKVLSAGCDDFMRKPFHDHELLEKIGQYLKADYLYEDPIETLCHREAPVQNLTAESLEVMSLKWRSQLYEAAAKVDNQEIYQLLGEIPAEYESLAKGLENLVEHFRCDKIIDLAKSVNQ